MKTHTLIVLVAAATLSLLAVPSPTGAQVAPPLCFGMTPTIVGTAGDDDGHEHPILTGTEGPDVIVGLEGDDRINGNGGDDRICGGPGADDIDTTFFEGGYENAAWGNDWIRGNGGPDSVVGSWTDTEVGLDDHLFGGSESDGLSGGSGEDFVRGGAGGDRLFGGGGDDRLRGNYGDDRLDDTFPRVSDHDRLLGQVGNDFIFADDDDTLDKLDGGTHEIFDQCRWDETATDSDTVLNCDPVP